MIPIPKTKLHTLQITWATTKLETQATALQVRLRSLYIYMLHQSTSAKSGPNHWQAVPRSRPNAPTIQNTATGCPNGTGVYA